MGGQPLEANRKYTKNYAILWVAHNAMLSFLKNWERQNKWCLSFMVLSFEDEANPLMTGKGYYCPDWGWLYCRSEKGEEVLLEVSLLVLLY